MSEFSLVYVTCSSKGEALIIAKELVSKKLAACVNVVENVTSVYEWQGKLEQNSEVILICKTLSGQFEQVSAAVKKKHSYSTPMIIQVPIVSGSNEYLSWARNQLQ